jgi:DNA modification methylase
MKYKVSNLHGDLNGEFTERKKVEPHPLGRLPYNYLLLPQDTTARPHPATMNPALANWAIRAYTRECDWVLDPMAGIGTTWIECLKLNRQFIGVELFEEYIEIAKFSVERYKEGKPPYLGLKRDWKEKNNE